MELTGGTSEQIYHFEEINLIFLKKIKGLDINLSYHHAQFQPNLLKIVEVMVQKRLEPVEDQSTPALLNSSK